MSDENPYVFRRTADATVEIGKILEFRAGRHIGIQRFTSTGPLHWESLIYTLDDFSVDVNGNIMPEMRAVGALPKHATGALAMGVSQIYTSPTVYTAKNASDIIHWFLAVPRRKQGGPVNDNSGSFKFVALFIPEQDRLSKFRIISKKTERQINRETMDYVNSLSKYEQNLVCGKWWRFFGCRMLR